MSAQNSDFLKHYAPLYTKAQALVNDLAESNSTPSEEALVKNTTSSTQMITTFQRILFGLDEKLKSEAVVHGKGTLEIILALATSKYVDSKDEKLKVETLKAIKCCVVRCAAGRNRCRAAGVFPYLKTLLEKDYENETITDQALTLLAAVSLNNDLNTLQVLTQMKSAVSRIPDVHPKSTQIQKMTTYLNALFEVVSKEQSKNKKTHSLPFFFDLIGRAQNCEIKAGITNTEYQDAESNYTTALKQLNSANCGKDDIDEEPSMDVLEQKKLHPLLKTMIGNIYFKRSTCRYGQKKYDDAIQDARKTILCLEGDGDAVEKAEKVRIQSLVDLRDKDAEQEIVKAKLFVMDAEFLDQMMKKLKL